MTTNRSLMLIVGGIAGLTLLAAGVVLLAGDDRQSFDPGTPEAAIQDYLDAWEADDLERTYAAFSDDVRATASWEEYRRAAGDYRSYGYAGTNRRAVYIDDVVGDGERVRVRLTVEEYYGDGFDGGSYRSSREVRMVREAGAWKIDEPLMWVDQVPFNDPFVF